MGDDGPLESLRARSGILEALVEASPIPIIALDMDTRVTMWNPASERVFGWSADEIVGEPYPLVPEEGWADFEGFFETVIGGEGFTGVEATRHTRSGAEVHLSMSTAPVRDEDGVIVGAMALLEDVTERKHLEERYRQAQKMEAVGRLAGGIAHDFNNVLTVILSYCDALLMTRDPARVLADVTAIQRAAERAAELTRQLLAFGRRQVLRARLIDVNNVVRGSVGMLRRLIGEDIAIRLVLDETIGPVRADPAQLEQLLMNLAANARDAMPDGGHLVLRTSPLTVTESASLEPGDWVQLSVQDDGEGMDQATLDRLFEPFFTTKELGRGTGLGLASVYGIVRQSGGQVDVQSHPGQGALFRIFLPVAHDGTLVEPREQDDEITLGAGATVLLAEDDPEVRNVVTRVLQSRGYQVYSATNGHKALELARTINGPVDLLLTDVVMEGMNGRQLAAQLATLRPGTPTLFMSGYTDDEVLRRGVEAGTAFLQKPFTSKELVEAIREVLDA